MVPDLLEDEATLLLDAYKILSQQANEDVRQVQSEETCVHWFTSVRRLSLWNNQYLSLVYFRKILMKWLSLEVAGGGF